VSRAPRAGGAAARRRAGRRGRAAAAASIAVARAGGGRGSSTAATAAARLGLAVRGGAGRIVCVPCTGGLALGLDLHLLHLAPGLGGLFLDLRLLRRIRRRIRPDLQNIYLPYLPTHLLLL